LSTHLNIENESARYPHQNSNQYFLDLDCPKWENTPITALSVELVTELKALEFSFITTKKQRFPSVIPDTTEKAEAQLNFNSKRAGVPAS